MRKNQLVRLATMLATGACMLQFTGCDSSGAFDFIQTILLGVTAAGSVYIIQNA